MPRRLLAEGDLLETDLVIKPVGLDLPGSRRVLFSDDFVCLVDAGHPAATLPMTAEVLGQLPNAAAAFVNGVPTAADRLLDDLGVERHVALLADDWVSLPWLLRGTDLMAVLPRRIASWAAQAGAFIIRELPGEDRAPFTEAAAWHPARGGDLGLRWLCGHHGLRYPGTGHKQIRHSAQTAR